MCQCKTHRGSHGVFLFLGLAECYDLLYLDIALFEEMVSLILLERKEVVYLGARESN
jgi:hypothetical protein